MKASNIIIVTVTRGAGVRHLRPAMLRKDSSGSMITLCVKVIPLRLMSTRGARTMTSLLRTNTARSTPQGLGIAYIEYEI